MKKNRAILVFIVMLICSVFCGVFASCGGDLPQDTGGKVVITYYRTEDSAPLTMKVNKNESFTFVVLPKRANYTFAGMYDAPSGGTMIIDENGCSTIVFTRDMTLYTRWTPTTHTIEFDAGEGSIPANEKTMSVMYGSLIHILPQAELEGHVFDGWYLGEEKISDGAIIDSSKMEFNSTNYQIPDKGNIVLTAKYSIKMLTVTFDYNDGSYETKTVKVEYGNTIPAEEIPDIDTGSKKLIAWSVTTNSIVEFSGAVTTDITLYGFWKKYKVFDFYNGIDEQPEKVTVYENEPYIPSVLTNRLGYEFDGWYTNKLLTGAPINDVSYSGLYSEFYARWVMVTYNLTLHLNGGVGQQVVQYTIEDKVELPSASKDNYVFLGWCTNEDLSDTPVYELPVGTAGVVDLYAKYKGETKSLILNAGAGSVYPSQEMVEYGTSYVLPVPLLAEHIFLGWYDGSSLNATKITDDQGVSLNNFSFSSDETTLYAHFMEKLYITVTINLPDAGALTLKEYYLEGETVNLSATLNPGYTFDGYYENGTRVCDNLNYTFVMGGSYMSLELVYVANVYTVILNANGGSCETNQTTVTFGTNYTLPVATMPGYKFIGWKLNSTVITNGEGQGKEKWNKNSNVTLYAYFLLEDPDAIFVYDAETLKAMSQNPSGAYVLVSDIDMAGISWTPFEFKGTFKGSSFAIKNLSISASTGNLGVFTKVTGTIQDLSFENLTVTSTSYNHVNVGGVCAELAGTLSNVTVSGSISGDFCRIGGIVAYMSSGTIDGCVNKATLFTETLETSNVAMGGIVGTCAGGSVKNCQNLGELRGAVYVGGIIGVTGIIDIESLVNNGKVTGKNYVGGVIALFDRTNSYTIPSSLKNNGEVVGNDYVGGIFGRCNDNATWDYNDTHWQMKISKLENAGAITGKNYVGGIAGFLYGNISGHSSDGSVTITVTSCVNTGNITGSKYVGGIFGQAQTDNSNSKLVSSSSSGVIKADAYFGGIAGVMSTMQVVSCDNTGTRLITEGYHIDGSTYYAYIGGYVGSGYYIEDCHNAVEINYLEKGNYVGGIAGITSREINNCSNSAKINAKNSSYVGGLVGCISYASGFQMTMLANTGSVEGVDFVGGIAGRTIANCTWDYNDSTYTVKIAKVTNSGVVKGNNRVGGAFGDVYVSITGYSSDGSVIVVMTELVNTGDVTGKLYVGGLVGIGYSDNGSSSISNSRSSANITAEAFVGGISGRLENVKVVECSNENSTVNATGYHLDNAVYYAYLGGYVGYGYYVENCHNAVEINYTHASLYVGGIAGRLDNAINNCSNTANITAQKANYVGGLIGRTTYPASYSMTNLTNSGAVTGKNYVGGIAGDINDDCSWDYNDSTYILNLSKFTNSGAIVGSDYVAGVVGRMYAIIRGYSSDGSINITVNLFTNTGDVTGNIYVGGLVGYAYGDNSGSTISNSSSSAKITAQAMVGGLAGRLENVRLTDSSNENSQVIATGYILNGTTYEGYVGGYVGYGYFVKNCNNAVAIVYNVASRYVGGIAGRLTDVIQSSTNSASITASNADFVSGLVGEILGYGTCEISNLTNSGAVVGNDYVGGIAGRIYNNCSWDYNDTHYVLTLRFITNTGDVSGRSYVAGITGYLHTNVYGYSSDGSTTIAANEITSRCAITGTGEKVAGLFGHIYTDNGNSSLTNYVCEGTVNETASTSENIIAYKENFKVN